MLFPSVAIRCEQALQVCRTLQHQLKFSEASFENSRAVLRSVIFSPEFKSDSAVQNSLLYISREAKYLSSISEDLDRLIVELYDLSLSTDNAIDDSIRDLISQIRHNAVQILLHTKPHENCQVTHRLYALLQVLSYIEPRNTISTSGELLSAVRDKPLNLQRCFFSCSGLVFDYDDLKSRDAALTKLSTHALPEIPKLELVAMARFVNRERQKDTSGTLEYIGNYALKTAVFRLLFLAYGYQVAQCSNNVEEYQSQHPSPDFFLFNAAQAACSTIGMASQSVGETCECSVTAATAESTVFNGMLTLLAASAIYFVMSHLYRKNYPHIREQVTHRIAEKVSLALKAEEVVTDLSSENDTREDRKVLANDMKEISRYLNSIVIEDDTKLKLS